jgi:hypothetical protein
MESAIEEVQQDDQLFPISETETPLRIQEIVHEDILPNPEPATSEMNSLDSLGQSFNKQRKVLKILILFDDGTFQEM